MRNIDKNKKKLPIEYSRSFLENIVVNGPVGIMVTDYDFVIKYMNTISSDIHNINTDNSSDSLKLIDFVSEPKVLSDIKETLISEKENNVSITYNVIINGDKRTIRAKVNLARDEYYYPIGGFFFICEDVTEIEKLQQKASQLEKQEFLKEIVVTYHHEMNNILGIIYGRAEMLLRRVSPDEQNRKYVENIIDSAKKLADIVKKIGKIKEIKGKKYIADIRMLDIDDENK